MVTNKELEEKNSLGYGGYTMYDGWLSWQCTQNKNLNNFSW